MIPQKNKKKYRIHQSHSQSVILTHYISFYRLQREQQQKTGGRDRAANSTTSSSNTIASTLNRPTSPPQTALGSTTPSNTTTLASTNTSVTDHEDDASVSCQTNALCDQSKPLCSIANDNATAADTNRYVILASSHSTYCNWRGDLIK